MTEVRTTVEWAGHIVTVGAQLVTVINVVEKTVEVVIAGTLVGFTMGDLAGQLVTSGGQEVTVTSSVEVVVLSHGMASAAPARRAREATEKRILTVDGEPIHFK
jgi:hypothetical protein